MANVVEVQITGKDLTQQATRTATANMRGLSREIKGVGSVMNATGNIATSLGNVHFAQLANQATMLAFAGKEVIQVFSKMNLVKASIAGLAIAAGAFAVEKILEEREARKKAAEDLETYLQLQDRVFVRIQELGNVELAEIEANKRANHERIQAVQALAIEQDQKNLFMRRSTDLQQAEETRIFKEQAERREKIAEAEKQKKLALQNQYVQGASDMLGNLATAALAFGKKGFAAYKAFAIAQAIVDTYKAANAAYAAMAGIPFVGPALGVAASAAAIAAGLANVAHIASMKAPQAHSGLDNVPQDATYVLKQGEMVLDPGTSDEVRSGLGLGAMRQAVVNIWLDGELFARAIGQWSRDGRLEIHPRAVMT